MQDDSQSHPSRPLLSDAKLPRFTQLPVFDPHRQSFECKHEADANPPITAEAEALFQQAMAVTSHDLWEEDRDYAKAARLYEQAMNLGHWKAQFNLAGLYLKGWGVSQNSERAIELTEDLMRKGVPAAWDNMGTMYMGGVGSLKQDATVAYAFWQRAADMGSMASQTYIGAKLLGNHDEPPLFWGNRQIGLKMLECAFAQGYGQAAYELGTALDVLSKDFERALKVLHEGVKQGSQKSAGYLFGAFDDGSALVKSGVDRSRARRYKVLSDALYLNPDLRFPNLDKILPLPPAALPKWNGDKKTLIDAAKPLEPVPLVTPTPGSQRTGRAHIPQGHVLPEHPVAPANESQGRLYPAQVFPEAERRTATFSGYWIARSAPSTRYHVAWNERQVPQRYNRGEPFEPIDRQGLGGYAQDTRVQWHYLGVPVALPEPALPMSVQRGIARLSRIPQPPLVCRGSRPCPRTGIWKASIDADHPLAGVYGGSHQQAYVAQGQPFPDPRDLYLAIDPGEVRWLWADNANQPAAVGQQITLSDLHDEQGTPLA